MNRRFAVPAAIALTAHALLFVGSGKPPIPSGIIPRVVGCPIPPEEEDIFKKAIELTKEEIATATNTSEKTGGGNPDEAPVGIPDMPHPEGPTDRLRFTQDPVPITYGHGKITANLGAPGTGKGDGEGWGNVLDSIASLDNPPRTRFQQEPVYPHDMKVSGTSGTVWVEFVVDEAGRVHDVHVQKSTHPGFEDATVAAVSQWRFESGKRKGIPVRFRMSIPVVFNLND